MKNYDKSRVSAHNLGQDLRRSKLERLRRASQHVARSDSAADPQDGLKCEYLHSLIVKLLSFGLQRTEEVTSRV